jgi:hypothetical protein
MQSISELYQEQCDKIYKLIEKDNSKLNLWQLYDGGIK